MPHKVRAPAPRVSSDSYRVELFKFFDAGFNGNKEGVRQQLQLGILRDGVEAKDLAGSPLFVVVGDQGNVGMLRFLHEDLLALVDSTNSRGQAASHRAARHNHFRTIEYLHSVGANLDYPDAFGMTQLAHAKATGSAIAFHLLKKDGADEEKVTMSPSGKEISIKKSGNALNRYYVNASLGRTGEADKALGSGREIPMPPLSVRQKIKQETYDLTSRLRWIIDPTLDKTTLHLESNGVGVDIPVKAILDTAKRLRHSPQFESYLYYLAGELVYERNARELENVLRLFKANPQYPIVVGKSGARKHLDLIATQVVGDPEVIRVLRRYEN